MPNKGAGDGRAGWGGGPGRHGGSERHHAGGCQSVGAQVDAVQLHPPDAASGGAQAVGE